MWNLPLVLQIELQEARLVERPAYFSQNLSSGNGIPVRCAADGLIVSIKENRNCQMLFVNGGDKGISRK